MMFEIRTPALRRSLELNTAVMDSYGSGTLDTKEAAAALKASGNNIKAVEAELKVRLALPKLNRFELDLKGQKQEAIEGKPAA